MKWDLCRLKFDNVSIIFIDSKTLIDTVQNFNTPSPSFGSLDSDDIKSTLKLLSCLDFAFVSKDVNILIHNLALWIAFFVIGMGLLSPPPFHLKFLSQRLEMLKKKVFQCFFYEREKWT